MSLSLLLLLAVEAPLLQAELPEGRQLVVKLDPYWSPKAFAEAWATGETAGPPAILELQGPDGAVKARRVLDAPLARLILPPLRTPTGPLYLVETDLTARMGSYNGPAAQAMRITDSAMASVDVVDASGQHMPLRVGTTGKSAWQRVDNHGVDDLLEVTCRPEGEEPKFRTHFRRLHPTPQGWTATERAEPGCWETDMPFPPLSAFPAP